MKRNHNRTARRSLTLGRETLRYLDGETLDSLRGLTGAEEAPGPSTIAHASAVQCTNSYYSCPCKPTN